MTINKEKDKIQKEAFLAAKKANFNAALLLATGAGKSKIMCDCILAIKPKTILYLCDSQRLRDNDFVKEMEKWGCKDYIPLTQFECYQAAYKLSGKYDLILGDETDFALSEEYQKAFFNNKAKHKILVSGTCTEERRKVLERVVPIVYELSLTEAKEKGILNKDKVYFVPFLLEDEENKRYLGFNHSFKKLLSGRDGKFTKGEAWQLQQLQLQRKHFLAGLKSSRIVCKDLVKTLYEDKTKKILIFSGLTEQADKMFKNTFHSATKDKTLLDKFNKGEIRFIVVINKVDRGLNLDGVNTIVFETTTRSKTKLNQRTGRGRRLSINDILHVYFLIPFFKTIFKDIKPTIVQDWIRESANELDLENATVINKYLKK